MHFGFEFKFYLKSDSNGMKIMNKKIIIILSFVMTSFFFYFILNGKKSISDPVEIHSLKNTVFNEKNEVKEKENFYDDDLFKKDKDVNQEEKKYSSDKKYFKKESDVIAEEPVSSNLDYSQVESYILSRNKNSVNGGNLEKIMSSNEELSSVIHLIESEFLSDELSINNSEKLREFFNLVELNHSNVVTFDKLSCSPSFCFSSWWVDSESDFKKFSDDLFKSSEMRPKKNKVMISGPILDGKKYLFFSLDPEIVGIRRMNSYK